MVRPNLFIGIDGGGSGSRMSMQLSGGEAQNFEGPALQGSVFTIEEVARRIIGLIAKGTELDKYTNARVMHICCGIAGFGDLTRALGLYLILEKKYPHAEISIFSDAAATFAATFGNKPEGNALLICGTGSVLVTFDNEHNGLRLSGGKGPDSYEFGSGRCIGMDFRRICLDKGIPVPDHSQPAELAPYCLEAASGGNQLALGIVEHHLSGVLEILNTAISQDALTHSLALHGGIFRNPFYKHSLKERMGKHHPEIHILDASADIPERLAQPGFHALPLLKN